MDIMGKCILMFMTLFFLKINNISGTAIVCADVADNASVADNNKAWLCQLIIWMKELEDWKKHVERNCLINETEKYWNDTFECLDLPEIRCVNTSEIRYDLKLLNCSIQYCNDGRYIDRNVLPVIWRRYITKYRKLLLLYNDQLEHCKKRSECDSTNYDHTTAGVNTVYSTAAYLRNETTNMPSTTTEPDTQLLDIILILDGSISIGTSNFDIIKTWTINQTLSIYDKFGSNAQVEVLQYSAKDPAFLNIPIQESTMFEIPFVFGECVNNESCVTERINNMPYLKTASYTNYALRRATEWEFLQSSRYPNATKVVVVVTDGEATDSSQLPTWWQQYGATGIVVPFAVGVGNYASFTSSLRTIANGGANDTRVFMVGSFADLHQLNIADAIKDEIY